MHVRCDGITNVLPPSLQIYLNKPQFPFLALTVACLGGSFHGVGVHQDKLDTAQKKTALLWFFLFEVFFCIAIVLIKLSISFMLARVAAPMRKFVYGLWVMAALVTTMNLISLFYIVFRCKPVSYFWDFTIEGGYCQPSQKLAAIYYADTAINIAGDWFCALTPIPLLWNLQMNKNAKLASGFLLSLGVLASLSACIRLKYTVNLNNSDDFLYGIGDVVIWGYAENGVGVIVGCISTLRPLFRSIFSLGGSSADVYSAQRRTGNSYKKSEFEMNSELPRPDKARAVATVNGPIGGRAWDNPRQSMSGSEEELVRDLRGGIRLEKSVHQSSTYGLAK